MSQKKIINENIDGKKCPRGNNLSFWYMKDLLSSWTIIPLIYLLHVLYIYRIKNKKPFVNFFTCTNNLHFAIKYCWIHHFAFNVIIFNSYLVLFQLAENNLTLTWNWNVMKNKILKKFSQISRSHIIWTLYVETIHWVCRINSIRQRQYFQI